MDISLQEPWLGRFTTPEPLRLKGRFHLYSTTTIDGGVPHVVVVPGDDLQGVAEVLDEVARVHALLHSSFIPSLAERSRHDGVEFLAWECDAITTLDEIWMDLDPAEVELIEYQHGVSLALSLGIALNVAHHTIDPTTNKPVCTGSMSTHNVLVSNNGRLYLIGFGHPLLGDFDRPAPAEFVAPEVAAGGPASPASDIYAFVQFLSSLLTMTVLPDALDRVVKGTTLPGDEAVQGAVNEVLSTTLYAMPHQRLSSLATLRKTHDRLLDLLGLSTDPRIMAEWLVGLQLLGRKSLVTNRDARDDKSRMGADPKALLVGKEGLWFRPPTGDIVDLGRRRALRHIFRALAENRSRAGAPMCVDELLEAGWPGEQPVYEAGVNRVHVALSTLRKLGLKDILVHRGEGYCLSSDVQMIMPANRDAA